MLYVEYEKYLNRFRSTQAKVDEILTEKEAIFLKTQTQGIRYDLEKITGGAYTNIFESYVIDLEKKKIDERLQEAKSLLEERKMLLDMKERELRNSKELYDKIYRMRYIDNLSPYNIGERIGYSTSQVYRILDKINKILKNAT